MLAILADKIGSLVQRCGIELAGAPLRLATLCDQSGLLQHLEMLRYG
ncbi:transcriptional regulator, ArsR family domain protein [Collimonas arenae]|uniref:Transcriptional regulator, ArsR family domain protein n=1 Tax=Collimonas arenae TaxID=279058 RepID=A0A127QMW9_9BURK|nr:transcriptional regulator, ArsR family domain protein [Collimonas arenae]AMP11389.1 transcriptional regulator, ArsR family domain protein [Collimonas arenae]